MRAILIAITLSFGLGAVLAGCAVPENQRGSGGIHHRIPDGGD